MFERKYEIVPNAPAHTSWDDYSKISLKAVSYTHLENGASELSSAGNNFVFIPQLPIADITTETAWLYTAIAKYMVLPEYSLSLIHICPVTAEERALIEQKMAQLPTQRIGAYLRKMAIDGYIIYTDTADIKAFTKELSAIGRNINQIAKRIRCV